MRPKLTVNVHLQNGIAVDASLTPVSREFLKRIAADLPEELRPPLSDAHAKGPDSSSATQTDASDTNTADAESALTLASPSSTAPTPEQTIHETIEVPLVFDHEFFDMLQSDVNNLDALQAQEEKNMTNEVVELGKNVAEVSKPSRFSKSDLARWRHIFELYLDAEVFFATHEQDHGVRSSQVALKQLHWFQNEVEKRQLAKHFKLAESHTAFNRFINLNASLLKNLQFQELNKLAVYKILKSKLQLSDSMTHS